MNLIPSCTTVHTSLERNVSRGTSCARTLVRRSIKRRNAGIPGWFLSLTVFLLLLAGITLPVLADAIIPSRTIVYFSADGKPFEGQVGFSINCSGYLCRDSSCTPYSASSKKDTVFSYSASCPSYGCAIYQSLYLSHRRIISCDMEGTADGTPFVIRNFSENPVPDCHYEPPFDLEQNGTMYRYSQEYHTCLRDNENTRTETCGKYLRQAAWAEIENSTGLSWYANNGSYWIRTPAYLQCISEMDRMQESCKTEYPPEPVDPETLDHDREGRLIWNSCTLNVSLPDSVRQPTISPTHPATGETTQQGTGNGTGTPSLRTVTEPDESPAGKIVCFISRFLGGIC